MKNSISRLSRGFTLIELLVVIAIIVLLTGIIVTNLTSSKAKARDAKRVSDVGQIQLALEFYFDRCKTYPLTLSTTANNGCPTTPTAVTLGTYISVIPTPPGGVSGQTSYDYVTSNTTAPTDYVLHTKLEGTTETLKDSLSDSFYNAASTGWLARNPQHSAAPSGFSYCYDAATHPLDYCVGQK